MEDVDGSPPTAADDRYALIARHSALALAEIDRGGVIRDANARWAATAGTRTGDDWLETIVAADRVLVEAYVRQTITNRQASAVDFRVAPDGAMQTWLRCTLIPIVEDGRARSLICAGIDVTREREAENSTKRLVAQVDEARNTLERIVDATDCFPYSFQTEAGGRVAALFNGPGRARLLGGGPSGEFEDWRTAIHPEDRDAYEAGIEAVSDGDRYEMEYRVIGIDGIMRWVADTGYVRRRSDGALLLDGAMRDVTRLRQLQDEREESVAWANEMNASLEFLNVELEEARGAAETLARTDPLTGLANRRRFTELLGEALGDPAGAPVGLVMLDIDRFKQINDRYGHASGDVVLTQVADRLRAALPEAVLTARIGGEEFVALLADTDEAGAAEAAERVRRAIRARPIRTEEGRVPVTASLGAASQIGGSHDELLSAADGALYAAKRGGRDRVVRASDVPAGTGNEEEAGWDQALRIAEVIVRLARGGDGGEDVQADVAELAASTARALGAPATDILRCRLAGWLHDIGKGAVPAGILEKPGPLDDAEWAQVREHSVLGERLVRDVPAIADAAAGVRHHHEHWDGGGYPDGLAGRAIPFEARVIAVADAWSAMTTDRPYRRPLAHDDAVAELRRCSGSQFDPDVVEAFCRVVAGEVDAAA